MSTDALEELRTLTVDELSRATGIQTWRIYAMLKEGTATTQIRFGSTYRFPLVGVRRWMEQRAVCVIESPHLRRMPRRASLRHLRRSQLPISVLHQNALKRGHLTT